MANRTHMKAATTVAAGIRQFENLIDESLIGGAELIATMLRARQDARLGSAAGHDALEDAFSALNHLLHARRAIILGHSKLDGLRQQLRISEVCDGSKVPMPEPSGGFDAAPSPTIIA